MDHRKEALDAHTAKKLTCLIFDLPTKAINCPVCISIQICKETKVHIHGKKHAFLIKKQDIQRESKAEDKLE